MENCEHCKKLNPTKLKLEPNFAGIEIEGATIAIRYEAYSVDSSFTAFIDINYCPICGTKLIN